MSKEHWSEYWRMGMLTSLPVDFKENYDGELASYWEKVISSMGDGSKVLDLCTGNGAIAILIKELSIKLDFNIEMTAVDASSINSKNIVNKFPDKKTTINNIQFISDCYVEDMNVTLNDQFDLIVSQYGVEYCDTQKAAKSVYEVLKDQGRFIFVAHSPDTAMLEYMKVEEQVFQLLEDNNVFNDFRSFMKKNISVNGFKNKLKTMLDAISVHELRSHALLKTWGQNMYQLFHMNNNALKQQHEQVGLFLKQHLNARARANDMLNVSRKLQKPDWIDPFKEAGLMLKNDGQILYQSKHNVGHFYEFYKP